MRKSLAILAEAQRLAGTGCYQALLDFLTPHREALKNSPTLALLSGSAHARLGQDSEATTWGSAALELARQQGDRSIEVRALNLLGAIALESGRMHDAASYFMRALAAAKSSEDHANVGRCSNNLGIVADQRGDYVRALSWYRLALAAYQQAGLERGIVETLHNSAMTHLAKGDHDRALEEADKAVREADKLGDNALYALTLSGRAEIHVLKGDAAFACSEVERALAAHRQLGDVVGEAQDLRILAMVKDAIGQTPEAEQLLREVIERADSLRRPHLAATAGCELAELLEREGRGDEARDAARRAYSLFAQLGALAEADKLHALVTR